MSLPSKEFKRLVTVSNQVAEYPPLDLSKLQYQALLVLISCIDSTEKPIYSIEDIVEEIKSKGITDHQEQMLYLEDLINRQNTYRIPYKEYLRYFTNGDTPQGGVIQRAMESVLSLNNKPFKFNNPEFEGSYVWFQAVALDKKNNDIVFVLTSFAKPLLMGLRRDFLQMLAESTMSFDGKYSVPIFLYLKSKLFDGRQEYHGSEPLEVFKRRFGLDGVKTYEKFYDFQRRILDVAEKDSTQSGDIRFIFTGKAEAGSKKIIDLQYSIYRIGTIKSNDTKAIATHIETRNTSINIKNVENQPEISHKDKLYALSDSQKRTYIFLSDMGINKGFIVDKILVYPALKLEILRGYEDVYFKLLWQWFLKKTKSAEKAAAFVAWWKNGRLTRDTVHWPLVEGVRQYIKNQERKQGSIFDKTIEIPKKSNSDTSQKEMTINKSFRIEIFKKTYPDIFKQIETERTLAFEDFRNTPNYNQLLKNSIESHCQQWWQQQV